MKKINILLTIAAASVITYGFVAKTDKEKQSPAVIGTNVGNKAPELKFMNPQGKEIALSSLKGKIERSFSDNVKSLTSTLLTCT